MTGPAGLKVVVSPSGDEFYNSAPRNGKPYNRASPAGRFPGLIIMAPFIFKGAHHRCRQAAYILAAEPPPQPSALKGLSNLRTFGAKAPSILRTLLSSEPSCFREYSISDIQCLPSFPLQKLLKGPPQLRQRNDSGVFCMVFFSVHRRGGIYRMGSFPFPFPWIKRFGKSLEKARPFPSLYFYSP